VDHGPVIESRPERDDWNAIDPQLVVDDQGRAWLAFGSFWSGVKLRRLEMETLQSSQEDPRLYGLARREGEGAVEAPFLYRRGEWWYLFVSFDHCCRGARSDYRIMVGRSREVTGPYLDALGMPLMEGGGTPVLEGAGSMRGPGHCAVVRDGDREWLVYHAYDAEDRGRSKLQVRSLEWTEEGWPGVGVLRR
jgi:arabinan endo-1,5-alpha-L-arabinosidase